MSTAPQELIFKFDGPGVSIESFGQDFPLLVTAINDLVSSCASDEVRFLGVENNCIKFTLAAALTSLSLLTLPPSSVSDIPKFNSASRRISSLLSSRHSTLQITDSSGVHLFDFQTPLPVLSDPIPIIHSTLAIYGELENVGGSSPNIHLRTDSSLETVVLNVDHETARLLASRLYQQVGVNASVTLRGCKVLHGRVLDVLDYDPEPLDDFLSHEFPGIDAFRGLNVSDYLAEQRG